MRTTLPAMALLMGVASCTTAPPPLDEAGALERGRSIAAASFQALSARLRDAMGEGGPAHAVEYCSVAAPLVADSVSTLHAVRIKRTSDRVRAAHDVPDGHERERLEAYLARLADGTSPAELEAEVFILGDSVAYYQPILIISPLCLACHGSPGLDLDSAAHAVVRARYPDDAAIGYALGDFRGLWSIRWER